MSTSEELWISRAVDRRAGVDDWRGLHRIAASDPDVWRRVCATLEAESALGQELDALLPGNLARPAEPVPIVPQRRARRAAVALVAAIVVVVAFALGRWSLAVSFDPLDPEGPLVAAVTPDELMQSYLREGAAAGRVLDQLPLRTLSSRRAPDGDGFDIVFVRSLVERARVQQLMTLAPDEHGEPQPLQIDLAGYIPPTDF